MRKQAALIWKRLNWLVMIAFMGIALVNCAQSVCASGAGSRGVLTRLDDKGYLYYMDYQKDYYSPKVMNIMRKIGYIDPGCSVFFTHNVKGEPVTCRNYDYPHRISKKDKSLTGLNVILHCKPEGKYESIAVADAVWCDENNPLLQRGGPDQEGFDPGLLDILPRGTAVPLPGRVQHVAALYVGRLRECR